MKNNPVVLERLFDASTEKVWKALTDTREMKNWYFDLQEFKTEVGFQFQFIGGNDEGIQYLHLCEITEIIAGKKLTYSWRYEGYSGISFVTFELFEQGNKTLLKLTHRGLETFPIDNPDFGLHNFENGWDQIINTSLRNYIEKDNFQHEITVKTSIENVFKSITKEIPFWWTEMFEGVSDKQGDVFTVRFGSSVFKTMQVEELIFNKKVVWVVSDTFIDIPELTNKREWLNTKIIWELETEKTNTIIRLTHIGLNPGIECYGICAVGWRQFCDSLKTYLEKGSGMPYKEELENNKPCDGC